MPGRLAWSLRDHERLIDRQRPGGRVQDRTWTKAPSFAALLISHPDRAGVISLGPVSWYGVASPFALSGSAGTMMRQVVFEFMLAVGVVVANAAAVSEAVGIT